MRKTSLILLAGFLGCVAAFAVAYMAGTATSRQLMRAPQPELAWLRKEFNLGDVEYARIVELHQAYLPKCAARCRLIEQQGEKLRQLMAGSSTVTPEIKDMMALRAKMRADCEAEMLDHFLQISRSMPPEQGRRYLAWVEQQTFLRGEAMEQHHRREALPHQH